MLLPASNNGTNGLLFGDLSSAAPSDSALLTEPCARSSRGSSPSEGAWLDSTGGGASDGSEPAAPSEGSAGIGSFCAVSSMLGSSTTAGSLLSSNTTFSLAIELCLDKALGGMELVEVLLDGDEDAGMLAAAAEL